MRKPIDVRTNAVHILDHCLHTDYPPCRNCADRAVVAALADQRRVIWEAAARLAELQPFYPDTHTGMRQRWVKDEIARHCRARSQAIRFEPDENEMPNETPQQLLDRARAVRAEWLVGELRSTLLKAGFHAPGTPHEPMEDSIGREWWSTKCPRCEPLLADPASCMPATEHERPEVTDPELEELARLIAGTGVWHSEFVDPWHDYYRRVAKRVRVHFAMRQRKDWEERNTP